MKVANTYKQNSPHWYRWRGLGLGASDAGPLDGTSPFSSLFELWLQKVKLLSKGDFSLQAMAAMERGKILEPRAREYYAKKYQVTIEQDVNCEDEEHEFLRASLDGLCTTSTGEQYVLEIKCPGKTAHEKALSGKVPSYYYPQLQFQLMVTGLPYAHYFSFDGEQGAGPIRVNRDDRYIAQLRAKAVEFWRLVQKGVAPRSSHKDVLKLQEEAEKLSARMSQVVAAIRVAVEALSQTVPAMIAGGEDMEEVG